MTTQIVGRALLVDDDDSWREILKEILEDEGFQVNVASTLAEADKALKEFSHRVAVVDLSLGGTDHRNQEGLEVLELLGSRDPNCQAILLTGYATVELAVSVITEGKAKTCLRKESFSRAEFCQLLNKAANSAPPTTAVAGAAAQKSSRRGKGLVVEDDAGWRELLTELVEEGGLAVVSCSSFAEARGHLERESFDITIVDLELSSSVKPENQDGLELLQVARKVGAPAVVVSGTGTPDTVERAFQENGVKGFFEKHSFDRQSFLELVVGCLKPSVLESLTEREREVLDLLAEGLTNQQIADKLFISTNTVKRHLKAVFDKLEVSNRAAAAAIVTRQG